MARAIHERSRAAQRALRGGQLRRAARDPAGVRAVRLREGRVHRRGRPQGGALRAGRRRHAVPRRGRRSLAGDPAQDPARAAGGRVRAAGRHARRSRVDVRIVAATNQDLGQPWCGTSASARISSTASTSSHPACRRCASAARTSRSWPSTSSASTRPRTTGSSTASATRPLGCLEAYSWPGNVRELENVVERAVVLARGARIDVADLPSEIAGATPLPEGVLTDPHRHAAGRGHRPAPGGDAAGHQGQQDPDCQLARHRRPVPSSASSSARTRPTTPTLPLSPDRSRAILGVMKALLVTREYPPHIYGGAGVVADQLSRALARRMAVEVRCFGPREPRTDGITLRGYTPWERAGRQGRPALRARAGDALDRAGHGPRRGGRRRGARPHVVRGHGRAVDQHALPHPAGGDAAQHGAAAPLEGRPARQRLPRVVLDREDRGGVGAPGDRRVAQDARGHPCALRGRPRARGGHPQRDRSRPRSSGRPRATRSTAWACARPTCSSSGASPTRRASSTCWRRRARCRPACRWCCAPRRPTRPEIEERLRPRGGRPAQREVDQRDGAGARGHPALQPRRRLLLPVGLRAVRPHQPGGDGLRGAGGGLGRGRHPRGRGGRQDRPAGAAGPARPRWPRPSCGC